MPRPLREAVGLRPGEIELFVDGAGLRLEPVATSELVEREGRLIVASSGTTLDDDTVRALRHLDQR